MAFFRVKKIKDKEYAYLVDNTWCKGGSRQKVKVYLGRAYRFDLRSNINFLDYKKIASMDEYASQNQKNKIISDLIEWEFLKFGINKQEFLIDLNGMTLQRNKKNVTLLVNDGFMCGLSLKNILEFKSGGDENADGYRLARCFVEAGIKVPQEIFVVVFGKLYKTTG